MFKISFIPYHFKYGTRPYVRDVWPPYTGTKYQFGCDFPPPETGRKDHHRPEHSFCGRIFRAQTSKHSSCRCARNLRQRRRVSLRPFSSARRRRDRRRQNARAPSTTNRPVARVSRFRPFKSTLQIESRPVYALFTARRRFISVRYNTRRRAITTTRREIKKFKCDRAVYRRR